MEVPVKTSSESAPDPSCSAMPFPVSGRHGKVHFPDSSQEARRFWSELNDEQRASIYSRMQLLVTADGKLPVEKFVHAQGNIYYLKTKSPEIRTYVFRDGDKSKDWYVAWIALKPKKVKRDGVIAKADMAMQRWINERGQSE